MSKRKPPSAADGLAMLKRADDALQDIRLNTSPDVRVDSEKYGEVWRRLQDIDGRFLDAARRTMVTTTDRRTAGRILEGLQKTNRVFDYISQALIEGALPESKNAPWPPPEWANADAMSEDHGISD